MPWKRGWKLSPVLLPGKFCGQRNLAGYSLWGHKESDTTEHMDMSERARAHTHTHTHTPNMFKRGFMFLYQVSSPYNLLHLVDFFPFLTRLSPIFTPSGNILALCKFWLLCITSTKSTWSELSSVLVLVTIIGSQLLLTGPFHASPPPHI